MRLPASGLPVAWPNPKCGCIVAESADVLRHGGSRGAAARRTEVIKSDYLSPPTIPALP